MFPPSRSISTATAVSRSSRPLSLLSILGRNNSDPDRAREAITERTKAVRKWRWQHFGGTVRTSMNWSEFTRSRSRHPIEDAAHAVRNGIAKEPGSLAYLARSVSRTERSFGEKGGMPVTSNDLWPKRRGRLRIVDARRAEASREHTAGSVPLPRLRLWQSAAVLLGQLRAPPGSDCPPYQGMACSERRLSDVGCIVWQTQPEAVTVNSWYLMGSAGAAPIQTATASVRSLVEAGNPLYALHPQYPTRIR